MMSKQVYKLIAKALHETKPITDEVNYKAKVQQWQLIVTTLSTMFANDNPAFDSERFEEACRYGKGL